MKCDSGPIRSTSVVSFEMDWKTGFPFLTLSGGCHQAFHCVGHSLICAELDTIHVLSSCLELHRSPSLSS